MSERDDTTKDRRKERDYENEKPKSTVFKAKLKNRSRKDSEVLRRGKDSEEFRRGKDSEEFRRGKDSEEFRRGKDSEEFRRGKDSEEFRRGKDSEEFRRGKDSEEFRRGKDSEESRRGKYTKSWMTRVSISGKDSEELRRGKDSEQFRRGKDSWKRKKDRNLGVMPDSMSGEISGDRGEVTPKPISDGRGEVRPKPISDGRNEVRPKPISTEILREWDEMDNVDLLLTSMSDQRVGLVELLDQKHLEEECVFFLIKSLVRFTSVEHDRERQDELLRIVCAGNFFDVHMMTYAFSGLGKLDRKDLEIFLNAAVTLITTVIDRLPIHADTCRLLLAQLMNSAKRSNLGRSDVFKNLRDIQRKADEVCRVEIKSTARMKPGKNSEEIIESNSQNYITVKRMMDAGSNENGRQKSRELENTDTYLRRPIAIGILREWSETDNGEHLLTSMTDHCVGLVEFLEQNQLHRECVFFLTKSLARVAQVKHNQETLGKLLRTVCKGSFLNHHLNRYFLQARGKLESNECEMFLAAVARFISVAVEHLPEYAIKCMIAISQLLCAVEQSDDLAINPELLKSLKALQTRAKELYRREKSYDEKHVGVSETRDAGMPPDDVDSLSVIPTASDLHSTSTPFVRPAVITGTYRDIDHYIDVQFRLLREDFMYPLRQGISGLRKNEGRKSDTSTQLRMYYGVLIVGTQFNHGYNQLLEFDVSKLKYVNWKHDKRFMHGSLVCLSKDLFQNVVVAVVVDSDDAERGRISVNVREGLAIVLNSTVDDVFIMAESVTYFEPYNQVLHGIREMKTQLPFQDIILHCNKQLKPPKYLLPSGGVKAIPHYNLADLLAHDEQSFKVPVLTTVKWPPAGVMCLNASQGEAVKLALTKELAIIQGPPGTGKTFVGLKVLQILLKNKHEVARNVENANDPILIVCYTNHALDQFLEGILEFLPKGIVRVGGSCKSAKLEQCNLKNIRRQMGRPRIEFDDSEIREVEKDINATKREKETLNIGIRSENVLKDFMLESHYTSLVEGSESRPEISGKMSLWLNTSHLSPIQAMPKLIQQRLVELVLSWKYPSNKLNPRPDMDIIDRACVYCSVVKRYREGIRNEQTFLSDEKNSASKSKQLKELDGYLQLSYKQIMTDSCFENYKLKWFLEKLESFLYKKEKLKSTQLVKTWLLGPHRSLHEQLDDIEILTKEIRLVNRDQNSSKISSASADLNSGSKKKCIDKNNQHRSNSKREAVADVWLSVIGRAHELKIEESDTDKRVGINKSGGKSQSLAFKEATDKLLTSETLSVQEESSIEDLWSLKPETKFSLYKLWLKRYKESLIDKMKELVKKQEQLFKFKKNKDTEQTLSLLKSAQVIGMTTTGAAKHRAVLQALGCRIIVVEEAAEVLESHIVTALNKKCNHLILIGDHQQLRPNPAVYHLAVHFGLEVSMFERLIKNNIPHVTLNVQHRMRPEIAKLMKHIYPDLENDTSVYDFENVRGISKNIFFIKHTMRESQADKSFSRSNTHEANYVVSLLHYLINQGYEPGQITILATYVGQVTVIKNLLKRKDVRVSAVDDFQGEENDIILLSLVRSNQEQNAGFLKTDNRVCVALSRAKKGLYVLGNFKLLASQSKLWAKIVATAENDEIIGSGLPVFCPNHPKTTRQLVSVTDFDKCPEGGCGRPCGFRLPCGHTCELTCHGYDLSHAEYECKKPCTTRCADGHPCKLPCFRDCGACQVPVRKKMPDCDHEDVVLCSVAPKDAVCSQKCSHVLPCGHQCSGKCGLCKANLKHFQCPILMEHTFSPCGHTYDIPCHQVNSNIRCGQVCQDTLSCGHKCTGTCSSCLQGAVHTMCSQECQAILPCGHKCHGMCGTVCKPCPETCTFKCRHTSCKNATGKHKHTCGEPCLPCQEKCVRKCRHSLSKKLCSQSWSRRPCQQKCERKNRRYNRGGAGAKRTFCDHTCAGVCGELCVCDICDQVNTIEKLVERAEASKGPVRNVSSLPSNSNKEGFAKQRLILKIPSCEHVFYVDELDAYIGSFDPDGTSLLVCPKCSKPITTCLRYEDVINERRGERERWKARTLKQNEMTDNEQMKFGELKFLMEEKVRVFDIKILIKELPADRITLRAASNRIKLALVWFVVYSLQSDSQETDDALNDLKDLLMNASFELTEQFLHEFKLQLLRCATLKVIASLEGLITEHALEIPRGIRSQQDKLQGTLGRVGVTAEDVSRAVTVILTVSKIMMEELGTHKEGFMLMIKTLKNVIEILQSKDEEMLCDVIDLESCLNPRPRQVTDSDQARHPVTRLAVTEGTNRKPLYTTRHRWRPASQTTSLNPALLNKIGHSSNGRHKKAGESAESLEADASNSDNKITEFDAGPDILKHISELEHTGFDYSRPVFLNHKSDHRKAGLKTSRPHYRSEQRKTDVDTVRPKYVSEHEKNGLDTVRPKYRSEHSNTGLDTVRPKYRSEHSNTGLDTVGPKYISEHEKNGLDMVQSEEKFKHRNTGFDNVRSEYESEHRKNGFDRSRSNFKSEHRWTDTRRSEDYNSKYHPRNTAPNVRTENGKKCLKKLQMERAIPIDAESHGCVNDVRDKVPANRREDKGSDKRRHKLSPAKTTVDELLARYPWGVFSNDI